MQASAALPAQHRIPLTDEIHVLGRRQLGIERKQISNRHLRIVRTGSLLCDTSSNGSFLNGERLVRGAPACISHGDVITLVKHSKPRAELTYRFIAALDDLDDLDPNLDPSLHSNLSPNLDGLDPNLEPAVPEGGTSSVASCREVQRDAASCGEMQRDAARCRVLRCSVPPPQPQAVRAMWPREIEEGERQGAAVFHTVAYHRASQPPRRQPTAKPSQALANTAAAGGDGGELHVGEPERAPSLILSPLSGAPPPSDTEDAVRVSSRVRRPRSNAVPGDKPGFAVATFGDGGDGEEGRGAVDLRAGEVRGSAMAVATPASKTAAPTPMPFRQLPVSPVSSSVTFALVAATEAATSATSDVTTVPPPISPRYTPRYGEDGSKPEPAPPVPSPAPPPPGPPPSSPAVAGCATTSRRFSLPPAAPHHAVALGQKGVMGRTTSTRRGSAPLCTTLAPTIAPAFSVAFDQVGVGLPFGAEHAAPGAASNPKPNPKPWLHLN